MYGWIIDFYCPAKMLLIEIDGEYHNKRRQRIADWYRDKKLKARGFKTIRFKNDEVLNHLLDVIKRIKWELR
jgi:very-short-patch-repair endonuclease